MFALLLLCVLTNAVIGMLYPSELPIEKKELFVPPLEEIAQVLNKGLKKYFHEVQVDVVDCPDLTKPPFTLANVGLNGNTRMISVGGVQNILPVANLTKVYDLRHLPEILDVDSAFIIGASSGPYQYAGSNCEGALNINIVGDKIDQRTKISIVQDDGSYITVRLPNNETRYDILADFFSSQGKPGPVLKIHVRKRIGSDSFSVSVRKALAKHYGSKAIALGGTFLLQKGKVTNVLVPAFSTTPFNTFQDVKNWLKYYNMSAPLVGLGVLVTSKYDLDLRLQHFHTFSDREEAGHYTIDVTPDIVEYFGYFNTAEYIYRIDKPPLPVPNKNEDD